MIVMSSSSQLGNVAKILHKNEINIATLTPDMSTYLNNIDIPARPLGDASGGLDHLAYQYGANVLLALRTLERRNGLEPGAQRFIDTMLHTYLYPRLGDLAKLSLTLDRTKPELLILHNDVEPINRCAALWARVNNVPCLHVPHAIYQDINRGPVGTDIHDLITASHLASAGPYQTKWYIKRGFNPANIQETGIPLFEQWNNWDVPKKRCQEMLGVLGNKPVVVYASTWPQHTNRGGMSNEWVVALESVLQFAAKNPIELIIKCHPGGLEAGQKYHIDQANKAGLQCTVTSMHLQHCLKAADCVVAYGSNVIIDAAFVGTRLVAIRGYEDDGEVINVEPDNVGAGIKAALGSVPPDCNRFLEKWVVRGNASERIASFAMELMGK